jgi:monoamine oxidase
MKDVIIIGAGMAGLSAALELKRRGISFAILEAQDQPGGRAITHYFPTGVIADLGAHWLHGKNNPLKDLLDHHDISYCKDEAKNIFIFENGKGHA